METIYQNDKEEKIKRDKEKAPDLISKYADPIEKANYVKRVIVENFRVNSRIIEIPEIISMASRIECYKKSRIRNLTNDEKILYDLLLKLELNPRTVFDWLTITQMPRRLKDKLHSREIRIMDALKEYNQWKKRYNNITDSLMVDIKKTIRRL